MKSSCSSYKARLFMTGKIQGSTIVKLGRLLFSAYDYEEKARKSCKKTRKTENSDTKETGCMIGRLCQGELRRLRSCLSLPNSKR